MTSCQTRLQTSPVTGDWEGEDGAKQEIEQSNGRNTNNGATRGFEQTLWQAADKLRNNTDAAEYKHVVLGLIFLKYISDAFEEKYAQLAAQKSAGADPEDPDEYKAENIFWMPQQARRSQLRANAKQPTIGKLIDDAMAAIERDNPSLKGVLPKEYNRPALDKQRLDELIAHWSALCVFHAKRNFRRVRGYRYLPLLARALRHDGAKIDQAEEAAY